MANATPLLSKLVLEHMFGVAIWTAPVDIFLALYTDTAATIEVVGGTYSRKVMDIPALVANATQSSTTLAVTFPGMPAVSINGYALLDAAVGTNRLMFLPLGAPLVVAAGDSVVFAAGQLTARAI